jgi:hypothetical protein
VPNTENITQSTLCVLWSRHIQYYYNSAYSGFNIQLNVSALLLDICRHFGARWLQIWCQIQRTTSGSCYVNCVPRHLQCIYSSAYSGFNIQLNVSALLLEISRQFNARYIARLVPNTALVLQFTLCVLWSRHIQCNYISAYSGFNIQLNVSALILEICRQIDAPYTANFVPNTARILQITLCGL